MVKLLWRTDVHLSDVAPQSRKDDWTETVLSKLRQVGHIASKLDVSAVLDGGDFFHVKSPGRNTHDLVRRVADVHKNYPCPVYANVGNHDCVYGDYKFLDQQPLGVLFATGVFQRCYDDYEVFFGPADATTPTVRAYPYTKKDGWLKGNPFKFRDASKMGNNIPIVRVVGVPYHGTSYDMGRFEQIKKGEEDFLVCMAHVLASASGGSMFEAEDIIKYADLAQYEPDVFNFGHWHKDQGIVQVGGKIVVNVGSLTRGALSQDEMERKPAVVLLEFKKGQPPVPKIVRLRVSDAMSVFDVEGRVRAETRGLTMDTFVDSIKQRLSVTDESTLEDSIKVMDSVPDAVRERVLLYLELARSS